MGDGLALFWILLLLVVQPLAGWRGRRTLGGNLLRPRLRLYRGAALGIAAIGLLSLGSDLLTGGAALRALGRLPAASRVWWVLPLAGCLALWAGDKTLHVLRGTRPDALVLHLLPRTRRERAAFVGLSALAGVAEEFAYRGLCLLFLERLTGSWTAAFVLTTLGFGLGHLYQGPGGVLRTSLAGAILAAPVVATGSLLPSVVAHFGLDATSGLFSRAILGNRGPESGTPPDGYNAGFPPETPE